MDKNATTAEETSIIVLSTEDIKSRVNETNKFTKEEVTLYREDITKARRAKRAKLKAMNANEQDARNALYREEGFTEVVDQKKVIHKNGDEFLVTKVKRIEQKAKPLSEMSVEEIMTGLGDKAGDLFKAMVTAAHAKKQGTDEAIDV